MMVLVGAAEGALAQACPTTAPLAANILSGDITTNRAVSGHVLLQGPVFVKNGATLTIAAGTVVRGQPRTLASATGVTAGVPGTLIVTQNGRVVAEGTASQPIIFTTAATDNDDDGVADNEDSYNAAGVITPGTPDGFKDRWETGDTFLDDTCKTMPLAPLDQEGNSNVSLWGGVVVLGNAPTNLADKMGVGYGKGTVEGLTVPGFPAADATYGGVEPHDNSGIFRYVSIRHAGDEIGNGNELNGLTLAGVGDGTLVQYVEVYANFDDGVEWFGGTVNGDHLAVFFVGDDSFDVDQGYTGTNQFLVAFQPFFNELDNAAVETSPPTGGWQPFGSLSGDKVGEFDGDDMNHDNNTFDGNVNTRLRIDGVIADPTPWTFSGPAFYNLTAVGSKLDSSDPAPDDLLQYAPNAQCTAAATPVACCTGAGTGFCTVTDANRGLHLRNGFAGEVHNTVIVNLENETGIDVATPSGTNAAAGFEASQNGTAGLLTVSCSTFSDVLTADSSPADETTVLANGDAFQDRVKGLPVDSNSHNNSVNPAAADFNLVNDDISFDPQGDLAGKLASSLKASPIDPRLTGTAANTANCALPRKLGLSPVGYRGAFAPGVKLWTAGWTTLGMAGLFPAN
jgi:hypothetical protein